MSSRNKAAVVSRTYNATPGVCAQAVKLLLDCRAKKEATRPGSPDDGTESKEDSASDPIIQQSA